MREIRLSGSEGGGTKPIVSPYPYMNGDMSLSYVVERQMILLIRRFKAILWRRWRGASDGGNG